MVFFQISVNFLNPPFSYRFPPLHPQDSIGCLAIAQIPKRVRIQCNCTWAVLRPSGFFWAFYISARPPACNLSYMPRGSSCSNFVKQPLGGIVHRTWMRQLIPEVISIYTPPFRVTSVYQTKKTFITDSGIIQMLGFQNISQASHLGCIRSFLKGVQSKNGV